MEKPVIILGAKNLGKIALDILQKNELTVFGLLDDDPALHGTEINFVPVLGSLEDEQYWPLIGDQCTACVAIDQPYRKEVVEKLKAQREVMPINAIHPSAMVAEASALGHGSLLNAGVTIGIDASIGHHVMLHTRAIVEHGASIGDWVQIGAGSIVGANSKIGKEVFIGAGATIISGVAIGAQARIGAGAVVIADVASGATVLGNPAKPVTA